MGALVTATVIHNTSAASPLPPDVAAGPQGTDTPSGIVGREVTLATLGLKIGDHVVVDATSAKPKVGTLCGVYKNAQRQRVYGD